MPARLARGQRVGNRYRLERELGHGTDGITWEAIDERLDRPVALRIFAGSDRKTIVKRAGLAASLTHPRVVRVFDTGEDGGRFYTVSELLPESLSTVRLPLSPDTALQTATDLAEALHYAHERGVVHGNLHEANVLLSEGGAKIGDFALSPASEHATKQDDLQKLGTLLGRIARMPDPAAPPGFERIIEGLASGAYTSAAEVLGELRAIRPAALVPRAPTSKRGWLIVVVALLAGLTAYGVMRLGGQSPRDQLLPGGKIEGTPLRAAAVKDFDPFGIGPPGENPGAVSNVIDGDPTTFWNTERYTSGPKLNKPGVGVILDLGSSKDVGKAQVLFVTQGCGFELRHSDDVSAPADEWVTSSTIATSPVSAAFKFDAAKARYWLVWITSLAADGTKFRCGIKEAELFAP
jgi:serine/threonine protein kinase